MKKISKALGIGALSLALASCGYAGDKPLEKVTGIPVSVKIGTGSDGQRGISTILEIGTYRAGMESNDIKKNKSNKTKIVCHVTRYQNVTNILDAGSLIQAEIDDKDNEPITIQGYKTKDAYVIREVTIEDYTIYFDDQHREGSLDK